MKLIELAQTWDDEMTLWDDTWDCEMYYEWSNKENKDDWDKAMDIIASKVDVDKISKHGVTIKLTSLVENALKRDKEYCKEHLTGYAHIEWFGEQYTEIFAGYVSERWMLDFANWL